MERYLLSINDLPAAGKEVELTDQEIWLEPLREFGMDCRIAQPLYGRIFVQTADDGLLIRGSLHGEVVVPCDRCAENARVVIASQFDEYEEIPEEDLHGEKKGNGCIVYERHMPVLNLAEVAWEQFVLAQPTHPLCREDCKGLCPRCGANLNLEECSCVRDEGDPRLAVLRGIGVKKAAG